MGRKIWMQEVLPQEEVMKVKAGANEPKEEGKKANGEKPCAKSFSNIYTGEDLKWHFVPFNSYRFETDNYLIRHPP